MHVVIDPGHGGKDPGAIGLNLQEKNVVLHLAFCLKMELEKFGHTAYLTRYRDEYVQFAQRVGIANKEQADLFISLHCNGYHKAISNGIEVYHFPGSVKGTLLAEAIQKQLVTATGLRDRGSKGKAFYVLRHTAMPAALVELGFITNPTEEKLLDKVSFLVESAKAITKGTKEYENRRN